MKTIIPIIVFVMATILFGIHNYMALWSKNTVGWPWHLAQWGFLLCLGLSCFLFGYWWKELFVTPMVGHSFFHWLKVPVTVAFTIIAGAFAYIYTLHGLRSGDNGKPP